MIGAIFFVAASAHADPVADARDLYDRGAHAYDTGDYAVAAGLLARADALAPNETALKLAIGSALRTEQAVLGEELALRADVRGGSSELADVARQAHDRFQPKVARVRVVCAGESKCVAHVNGAEWRGGEVHATTAGRLDATFDDHPVRVEGIAGAQIDLAEPLPPPLVSTTPLVQSLVVAPRVEQPHHGSGLSPAAFWIGTALTLVAGGFTIASGIDTADIHRGFVAAPSIDGQLRGESAQLRTNVLAGSTIAVGVASLVIGLFFTRWRTHTR